MARATSVTRAPMSRQVGRALDALFGSDGAVSTALGFGGGTSADPMAWSAAGKNHEAWYTKSTATSGDSRGLYRRHYIAGAGGAGEAIRAFTTVLDVAAANAHGAHISCSFGSSGSITGQATATRSTLQIPNAAVAANGTYSAEITEIYSDGSTSDPAAVTRLAFQRFVFSGNATGAGKAEDVANLFTVEGGSIASGNMVVAKSSAAVTHVARINLYGTAYYLMISNQI